MINPYNEYKISGVPWIGHIPSHWNLVPMKRLVEICSGQDAKNVSHPEGDYPIYGSGGEFGRSCEFLYEGESVLLGRKGTIDKPIYLSQAFWTVDTAYFTKMRSCTVARFFYYLSLTINFDLYRYGSAVPSMSSEVYNNILFALPDKNEQQLIVNFLDEKTSLIDETIKKKQQLIELLQDERTAIINKAVTRGLDDTVPMKDSGVEWIGDVPEHWSNVPIRWCCKVFTGGTPSKDKEEYWSSPDIPWLNSGEINKEVILQSDNYISDLGFHNSSAKWIRAKSVLMALAGQGKTKGIVAALETPATCNQSMAALEPIDSLVDYKYMFYYLKSRYLQIRGLVGDDRDGLNLELIKSIILPLPPLNEQKSIKDYIEIKTTLINKAISKEKQLIEMLQEYRTALINEVVTGKRRVSY